MRIARVLKLVMVLFSLALAVNLVSGFSCQLTPESQKSVEEATTVPGLAESLLAKDLAIKAAIQTSLASDVELLQNKIDIEVSNGKVILTGSVPSEEMKARAEKYANETKGVVDVLNKIEVDPTLKDKQFSLDDA